MPGYLYLIHMIGTTFYKIGVSDENPSRRVGAIQSSSPFEIRTIETYHQENYRKLEKEIHYALRDRRVRGEWFNDETGETVGRVFRQYNNMATVDSLICDTGKAIKQPEYRAPQSDMTCPKCKVLLAHPQWLAARRWGHCSNCKNR